MLKENSGAFIYKKQQLTVQNSIKLLQCELIRTKIAYSV